MKIRFAGKTFDMPPPVAAADEAVVAVDYYVPLNAPASGLAPARPMLSQLNIFNLRKVLFFLFREGFALTLAKVRAVLAHRRLDSGGALVVASGTEVESGRRAIAFGWQDCPDAEQLCFPRRLVAVVGDDAAVDHAGDARALLAYIESDPEMAARLRNWSRFSGRPLPITLAEALAKGRRSVKDDTAPVMHETVPVRFGTGQTALTAGGSGSRGDGAGRGLFLAGAGTYPCAYVLPEFARARIPFDTVMDLNPARAAGVAARFGFVHADTDTGRGLQRLADYESPVLVIATYHSTHADVVEQAIAVNPATRIMLEKPPVTTLEQLHRLDELRRSSAWIEIGYNRRHAPMIGAAQARLKTQTGPVVMTCLLKELVIPPSHWYYWPKQGTRITGNLCHWLDLGRVFIGARPQSMTLVGPWDGVSDGDVSLVVTYGDGSRLTVVASERGNSLRGVQEYIEVRRGDLTIVIDDFLRFRVQAGAANSVRRRQVRDKGHRRMYARFIENVQTGRAAEYPAEDLMATTIQYLRASAALQGRDANATIDLSDAI